MFDQRLRLVPDEAVLLHKAIKNVVVLPTEHLFTSMPQVGAKTAKLKQIIAVKGGIRCQQITFCRQKMSFLTEVIARQQRFVGWREPCGTPLFPFQVNFTQDT